MELLLSKSPPDVTIATKGKYIGISHAGKGISADVYFALPQSSLKDLNPLPDLPALRSQVCAVKLYKLFSTHIYINKELPAIKHLTSLPSHLTARFTEPLSYSSSTSTADPAWYAMRAVHGFQLTQLNQVVRASKRVFPAHLVFHAYIQLHEALTFLHTSDPPMLKGDLIAVNVMVEPGRQDTPGFPNFKLIDFGASVVGGRVSEHLRQSERGLLYRIVYDMAVLNHGCEYAKAGSTVKELERPECVHEIEFADFVDTLRLRFEAGAHVEDSNAYLEVNLQDRLPKVLAIKVKYTPQETLQAIEELMQEASNLDAVKFPTDQQILDAFSTT